MEEERTRPQTSNIIIMMMKAEMLSLYSGLPSSLTSLSVYVYSSIYISTVKSAIDGVDIDVVCVCSAGKEVGGTTEPAFFNFPRLRGAVCVCVYKGESTRTRCEPKGSRDQKRR
jgi:hypothetical protein